MGPENEAILSAEIQRLVSLLGLTTSIYNIETRVCTDGKPYIMELSPRGGGNRLAEMIRHATGVDLISNAVRAAVGLPVAAVEQKPYNGHWAEVILHAAEDGVFQGLDVVPELQANAVEVDLWVKPGDTVHAFRGANDAIGTLVLKFDTEEELTAALKCRTYVCRIKR